MPHEGSNPSTSTILSKGVSMNNIRDIPAEDCLEYLYDLRENQGYHVYLEAAKFLYEKYKIPDLMVEDYVQF